MGIPLDVFSLYQFQDNDTNCDHYLLVKVEQPAFSNANESEYEDAVQVADRKRSALIEVYKTEILTQECAGSHGVNLVGELQACPTGNELFEEEGGFYLNLWVAETRFGHPWVVMGTAEDEEQFWQDIEQNEDLSYLGASRPASMKRVFFLTEKGHESKSK
ncbi:MAG TPA: hypothetical protein V6C65_39035 [Allocoleopsis sp.]